MSGISNLLQYDIRNIQYNYQVTNATLSANQNHPSHKAQTEPGQLTIRTEQPQIRQDSTDFFASIGMRNIGDYIQVAAKKGKQAALEATANFAIMGRRMGEIEKGIPIAELYRQKFLQQANTTLVVTPTEPVRISCTPGKVETRFTPSSVRLDWDVARAARKYSPPDFDLTVTRYPEIAFTYLGGHHYVPESSAPGFDKRV